MEFRNNDPEVWLSEDEPIATFFLRLPETVGWPPDHPIPKLVKIGAQLHSILEPLSEDDSSQAGEASDSKFHSLIRAHVMVSSVLLRQVHTDLGATSGMDVTMAAVKLGVPGEQQRPIECVGELKAEGHLTGYATVAEVSIPLQTLAAVTAVDEHDHEFVLPKPQAAEELVEPALDAAIDAVRDFQSAYHAVTRQPLSFLTRELLPPIVPYVVRAYRQIEAKDSADIRLLVANSNVSSVSQMPTLGPDLVDNVYRAGSQKPSLLTYLDLYQQGSSALFVRGNTRETVVMMAAASEALLNIVLCHMRWEDGLTPEESAETWPNSLSARVKKQYSICLGGDWNMGGNGPVGKWAKNVAAVRHRVVHGGYLPSRAEAKQSLESLEGLLSFVGDRLVYGRNLRKYPRTASELLKESGLQRRRRYPNWLRDLQESPSEPLWRECFGAWYATHLRLLGDDVRPRVADESRSELLCVYTSPESYGWVVRDPITRLAAEAEAVMPPSYNNPVVNFREIQEVAEGGQDPHFPISIAYVRSEGTAVTRVGPWVEEYHVCPNVGVMLDGSDFAAPWPVSAGPI